MAPDALPSRSPLSRLASPSPTPVHELAHHPGNPATLAGREGGPRAGTGWHLGCGRRLPSSWSQTPRSRPTGHQEAPQGSQAPEVVDKAGLCPFKELWFEESRCPVGTRGWVGPVGPDADAQLQT